MKKVRYIELLSPAKNVDCGIEAVKHGADAVYIGAPKFGARAAAGNSIDDIARLVSFAHLYGVRIYVTLNVILKDEELDEVMPMVDALYRMGVDALIVQDMALLQLPLPPIALHASTQVDNRDASKVAFLARAGFRQVVLARELSLSQIRSIHEACPDVPLEAFVHGALCVSFSGQCYASEACFGRSANRGECSQFCRLAFDMVDAEGRLIEKNKHLLSLRDMNRSDRLEEMIDAGITSFKIEGRLKDVSYVKNVTAYYRQKLDAIIARRPEYARASMGTSTYTFTPQLNKSFNRGFTHYFLDGRGEEIASPDTPKSMGEPVGQVKESRGSYIVVAGISSFHNGDGVCYLDESHRLQGFRVNRVEGNHLFPQGGKIPYIKPHTPLYRNFDQAFDNVLSSETAIRRIGVSIVLWDTTWGFACSMTDEEGRGIALSLPYTKEVARSPQQERIRKELAKLGNTPFEAKDITVNMSDNWFIPASVVADLRRRLVDALVRSRRIDYRNEVAVVRPSTHVYPLDTLTYLGNVMNREALQFYHQHGVKTVDPAFEARPVDTAVVMFCKHCLRFENGWCPQHQKGKSPYKEPYYLVLPDSKRFRLEFDCKHCEMKVVMP